MVKKRTCGLAGRFAPARSVLLASRGSSTGRPHPLLPNVAFAPIEVASTMIIGSTKNRTPFGIRFLVDATRFELATSASRTQRSTKLSHASNCCCWLSVSLLIISFDASIVKCNSLFTAGKGNSLFTEGKVAVYGRKDICCLQ